MKAKNEIKGKSKIHVKHNIQVSGKAVDHEKHQLTLRYKQ